MSTNLWVDCYIGKYITLNPDIKLFNIMLNRWCFSTKFKDDRLVFDYSEVNKFEDKVSEFYNRIRRSNATSLEQIHLTRFPVIIPCDAFYLPYVKEHFQKKHLFHYLLLLGESVNKFEIYDDNPYFNDNIDKKVLIEAHRNANEPIEWYELTSENLPGIQEEVLFFCENFDEETINFVSMLTNIINFTANERNILKNIDDFRIPIKRLNGLLHIINSLERELNIKIDPMKKCVEDYIDQWFIITLLAGKALITRKYETTLNSIRKKTSQLASSEQNIKYSIRIIKDVIRNKYRRDK